jgi:oxaloacetate decarboxylase gamma subunit
MTITEMFGQSTVLTLLGMAVVFSFLIILIIAITCLGKIVHSMGWDKDLLAPPKQAHTPVAVAAPVGGANPNVAVTAAISAAVTEYRKSHN